MLASKPNYTMRASDKTLELQVLKQAKDIMRRRRGNECNYNVVYRVHYTMYSQADEVSRLYLQRPKERMGRKLVQDKLRHCHRVRRSSLGSHFSKAGKGESGDNPKPKPHPIDPGQGR